MRHSLLTLALLVLAAPLAAAQTYTSSPGLAIPDNNPAGVSDVISVPDTYEASDVNVALDISHTWVGDLVVTVEHPLGGVVTLIDRPGKPATFHGCSEVNVDAVLDDEGPDGPAEDMCGLTPPAIYGSPMPNEPLSAFDGLNVAGDWTLTVSDNQGGDTGTLNSWSLLVIADDFAVGPLDGPGGAPIAEPVMVPASGATVYYAAYLSNPRAFGLETQVWPSLEFPDGSVLVKRRAKFVFVPSGETRELPGSLLLRDYFPSGTYTFVGYEGSYPDEINQTTSFTIEKAAGATKDGEAELTAAEAIARLSAELGDDWVVMEPAQTADAGQTELPMSTVLGAAYPNPFNPSATVPFTLAEASVVTLAVYDVLGREVARLVDGMTEAGSHTATFDGARLPSGAYLVRLVVNGQAQTQRLTLVK